MPFKKAIKKKWKNEKVLENETTQQKEKEEDFSSLKEMRKKSF